MPVDIVESGASDQEVRQFVDRIRRLLEERDGITGDIKDVYAEARGRGYDKTALGALVTYLRKREKNGAEEDEKAAIFDLYLTAYERAASHTHAPARTRGATTNREMDRATESPFGSGREAAENARKAIPVEPEDGSVSHAGPGESPGANPPLAFKVPSAADYRPHCRARDACGASGLNHCFTCQRLIDTAVQTEAA